MTYRNLEKSAFRRQLIGAGIGAVAGGGAGYLGSSRGAHEDEESFGRRRLGNTLIGGALGGALGGGIGHMTRAKPAASKPAASPRPEQSAVAHEAPRPPQGGGSTPAAKPTGAPRHQYYIGDVQSRYTAEERAELERILRRQRVGTVTLEEVHRLGGLLTQGNARLFRTRGGYLVVDRDYVPPERDPAKIVPHWEAPKMNKTSAWRDLPHLARVRDQSDSLRGAFEGRDSALRAARPVDAGFMQSIGAKPVPQLIGRHIEPVVESPHYMVHGLKPVVIGTPGPKVP